MSEFTAQALDSLRAPLETGEVVVARANAHVRYPARVQLVAAMNPCRCGHGGLGRGACGRAPRCQQTHQSRISGPLLDRIDLQVEVPPVTATDLALPAAPEGTAEAAARVAQARAASLPLRNPFIECSSTSGSRVLTNALRSRSLKLRMNSRIGSWVTSGHPGRGGASCTFSCQHFVRGCDKGHELALESGSTALWDIVAHPLARPLTGGCCGCC